MALHDVMADVETEPGPSRLRGEERLEHGALVLGGDAGAFVLDADLGTAGAAAPKLVSRDQLKLMRPGSVLVDVAIDQGGCFETSKATTHQNPTYEVDGIIHYCVANMPGAVPVTSAHALNNATIGHGLALADRGIQAILADKHLRNGLNVHKGKITNKPVADALGLTMHEPEVALAA